MEHFNQLNPDELERLAILMEECAEVQQVIGKILRHGYESHHPDNSMESNRFLLTKEMGDLKHAMKMIFDAKDVHEEHIDLRVKAKARKIQPYLHHQ